MGAQISESGIGTLIVFGKGLALLLVFVSSAASAASPVMQSLIGELSSMLKKQGQMSGSLYIDSKFYGRFQALRRPDTIDFSMIGPLYVDYRYGHATNRLVIKTPEQAGTPGLVLNSANMKSIEWLLSSIESGVLSESPYVYQAKRKLGSELDVFEVEVNDGPIKKVEVSFLDTSTHRSLVRMRMKDLNSKVYTFNFD